jgi:hypothetical protein
MSLLTIIFHFLNLQVTFTSIEGVTFSADEVQRKDPNGAAKEFLMKKYGRDFLKNKIMNQKTEWKRAIR